MNLNRFYKITGFWPESVRSGFVRGDLYKVTDYTEPNGIYEYPMLITKDETNVVICLEITLQLNVAQQKVLWAKLNKYEGDLYQIQALTFYPFGGKAAQGYAYVAKCLAVAGKINIVKMEPVSTVYLWSL